MMRGLASITRVRRLARFALTLVMLAGCLTPAPPTADEVRSRMTAYLFAWNGRDYAGWTEGWSDALLADSDAAEWRLARDRGIALSGPFVAIEALRSEPLPGERTRWIARCRFTEATLQFTIVLPTTGGAVMAVTLGAS